MNKLLLSIFIALIFQSAAYGCESSCDSVYELRKKAGNDISTLDAKQQEKLFGFYEQKLITEKVLESCEDSFVNHDSFEYKYSFVMELNIKGEVQLIAKVNTKPNKLNGQEPTEEELTQFKSSLECRADILSSLVYPAPPYEPFHIFIDGFSDNTSESSDDS